MSNENTVPVMANILPWNEAILRGIRTFKTLRFNWSYRGPLMLYNSHGRLSGEDMEYADKHKIAIEDQPKGHIVGIVDVVGCERSDYDEGIWHVALRNPIRVEPVPYKPTRGSIRISRAPLSLLATVRRLS